jgi:hypothetical protein
MMTTGGPTSDGEMPFPSTQPGERQAWQLLFVVVAIILVGMAAMAAVTMGYGFPLP